MAGNDLITADPMRDDVILYGVFNSENELVFVHLTKHRCEEWINE